jgi:hypothetical protein
VLVVLDEFATLGHMQQVEDSAGQIAGHGVKLWPILQDLSQLHRPSFGPIRFSCFLDRRGERGGSGQGRKGLHGGCVVNQDGAIIREIEVAAEPGAIDQWLKPVILLSLFAWRSCGNVLSAAFPISVR